MECGRERENFIKTKDERTDKWTAETPPHKETKTKAIDILFIGFFSPPFCTAGGIVTLRRRRQEPRSPVARFVFLFIYFFFFLKKKSIYFILFCFHLPFLFFARLIPRVGSFFVDILPCHHCACLFFFFFFIFSFLDNECFCGG